MGSSPSTRRRNDRIPPYPCPRPTILVPPTPPSPRSSPPSMLPPPPPPVEVAGYSPPTFPPRNLETDYPLPALSPPPLPARLPYLPNPSNGRSSYPPNYYHYSSYAPYPGGYCAAGPEAGPSVQAYYVNPRFGCTSNQSMPSYSAPPPPPDAAPYVDQSKATTIRNDVNLNKDTIRLEVDAQNSDHHLVAFTFDATVDGCFTIFYMAKEGEECRFSPQNPDVYRPMTFPFQKGSGQKFCQPSGTGIDLGFFEVVELERPSLDETFPLVILAEASLGDPASKPRAQITLAVLEKKLNGQFQVKVIKQILWIDGARYELRSIYGITSSSETDLDDDAGKDCVICMTEKRAVTVLPCLHMCMCSECAEIFRRQSSRCPICRDPVEELIEIKV